MKLLKKILFWILMVILNLIGLPLVYLGAILQAAGDFVLLNPNTARRTLKDAFGGRVDIRDAI